MVAAAAAAPAAASNYSSYPNHAATDRIISSTIIVTLQSPRIVPRCPRSPARIFQTKIQNPFVVLAVPFKLGHRPELHGQPGPVHLKGTQDRSMGWFVQPLNHGVPTCRSPLPSNQTCAYLEITPWPEWPATRLRRDKTTHVVTCKRKDYASSMVHGRSAALDRHDAAIYCRLYVIHSIIVPACMNM